MIGCPEHNKRLIAVLCEGCAQVEICNTLLWTLYHNKKMIFYTETLQKFKEGARITRTGNPCLWTTH